ncbi:MAG: M28 family peptidase [Bacteroidales bacterium]|nr:M28 family peptidase [Bacteroidales bacterium]MCB9013676.1 M28 family peptidase [Bacteroidales bacterium]
MNTKEISILLLLACLFASNTNLSAQLPKKVNGEKIKSTVDYLASDEFRGRETGTDDCRRAEDYFASELKKLKLIPAGENGSYFYSFSFPDRAVVETQELQIDDRTFYSGYGDDFNLVYGSDGGSCKAEIVFAGYGIYSPEKTRNDFENINIKGKVVLIKRGAPKNDIRAWRPACIDSVKAEYCYKNGAVAVMFFEPAETGNKEEIVPDYTNIISRTNPLPDFPIIKVDEKVARFVFKDTDYSYYRIISSLENKTSSFNSGKSCTINIVKKKVNTITGRDVLGILPGTDPLLKNEYVVIGGHIDHVGVSKDGEIRNGADDNASGPSVTLGIAQAMVKNKFKPKRSIVFVAWTGEEKGLWGSRRWCENPTIPLEDIVVYFNLDMVGLGDGNLNMPGTEFAPEVYNFLKSHSDSSVFANINWSAGGLGGSDHNYFLLHGVPAFAGMTSGPHPDYHTPADDPDKIKTSILQLSGDFIYYCAEKIAGTNEAFLSESRMAENRLHLVDYDILKPIRSSGFETELDMYNSSVAIVDFSDIAYFSDPQVNALRLLIAIDSMANDKNAGLHARFARKPYEAFDNRRSSAPGVLAMYNPLRIHYDESWFRILATNGFKLVQMNAASFDVSDESKAENIISYASAYEVGLFLDNLPIQNLMTVLEKSENPCLILSQNPMEFSEELIKLIKEGDHLLVYQIDSNRGIEKDFSDFQKISEKLGIDLVSIAPGGDEVSDSEYFKTFILKFLDANPDRFTQSKILNGNFMRFAAESMQP